MMDFDAALMLSDSGFSRFGTADGVPNRVLWRFCGAVVAGVSMLLTALCWAPGVVAEELIGYEEIRAGLTGEDPDFSLHGDYRIRYVHLGEFPLDEMGTTDKQNDYAAHRLRVSPMVHFGHQWRIFAEVDLIDGIFGGEISSTGALAHERSDRELLHAWINERRGQKIDSAELRHLYLEWKSDFGVLRVGQMGSRWGMGLLANDGARDRPFSDAKYGDVVERVLFATAPIAAFSDDPDAKRFTVALGADLVYQDDNAVLRDGDVAFQGVLALNYRFEEFLVGMYAAFRHQKDSDGDNLRVWAVDVAGDGSFDIGDGLKLRLAAEAVALFGTTDRVQFEGIPASLDIRSFGGALSSGVVYGSAGLDFGFEVGFASGDNHPSDGTLRSFSFDPDHTVGMILFEEALGRLSLRAADRVADPSLSGTPPKGFEALATNGAVRNAFYVNPVVRFLPVAGLTMAVGFLWAMSPGEPADAFLTAQRGGYPQNYLGGVGGKNYGYELDASFEYAANAWDYFGVRVGAQAGLFVPGSAFEMAGGEIFDPVVKVRGLFDIFW
ncbi:MAG: hypothetical protein HUU55_15125 [Myxococcales bacterium]|nr:hypothetical protein [Myxococcales bacterium]